MAKNLSPQFNLMVENLLIGDSPIIFNWRGSGSIKNKIGTHKKVYKLNTQRKGKTHVRKNNTYIRNLP